MHFLYESCRHTHLNTQLTVWSHRNWESFLRNNILTAMKSNENTLCQCCFLIRSDLFFLALLWSLSCSSARWTEPAMDSTHTMANGINFLCDSIFSLSSISISLHTFLHTRVLKLNFWYGCGSVYFFLLLLQDACPDVFIFVLDCWEILSEWDIKIL